VQHDSAASRLPQKHPVVHIIVLLSVENQIKVFKTVFGATLQQILREEKIGQIRVT
jgi:hypothetical protein